MTKTIATLTLTSPAWGALLWLWSMASSAGL